MKISKGAITSLARQGYLTLQVPDLEIRIGEEAKLNPKWEIEELPDAWFCRTKCYNAKGSRLVFGREQGFLYLTREGWEANREALKEAFQSSSNKRGDWPEFVEKAENFLRNLDSNTAAYVQKKKANLKRQLFELEQYRLSITSGTNEEGNKIK